MLRSRSWTKRAVSRVSPGEASESWFMPYHIVYHNGCVIHSCTTGENGHIHAGQIEKMSEHAMSGAQCTCTACRACPDQADPTHPADIPLVRLFFREFKCPHNGHFSLAVQKSHELRPNSNPHMGGMKGELQDSDP